MSNHYAKNLETGKLELHFDKATYQALPDERKDEIKRAFLWSSKAGAWVSRSSRNTYFPEVIAKKLGLTDNGTVGEKLSFAERVEVQAERAEERAERSDERAEAAKEEAHARFNSQANKTLSDMQGEPVKIGHHSERRHRKLIEKAWNDMGKGAEAWDKAKHYQHRAETARATAEGAQYSNPAFLSRRITEGEAEKRLVERRLLGKFYEHSDPAPISDEYRAKLTDALDDVEDRLDFYRHCLETCGGQVFTRESLKGKTAVKIRGQWETIVKLNPTTVAVPNICYRTEEQQRKWAMKYPYAEVQDAK